MAIQQNQLIGQSFTPALSTVGFIRLRINNGVLGDTSAATLYVKLIANSLTGSVLGQSQPVSIPGGSLFVDSVDFIFQTPVPVSSGAAYYFQPVVQDNNNLGINSFQYNYAGGMAFFGGVASPNRDLWFREGIVGVPEPSSAWLVLLGSGVLFYVQRKRLASS